MHFAMGYMAQAVGARWNFTHHCVCVTHITVRSDEGSGRKFGVRAAAHDNPM